MAVGVFFSLGGRGFLVGRLVEALAHPLREGYTFCLSSTFSLAFPVRIASKRYEIVSTAVGLGTRHNEVGRILLKYRTPLIYARGAFACESVCEGTGRKAPQL